MDPRLLYIRQRLRRRGGANPLASVTRDATSNVYVPADSTEWSTFISATGLSVAVPDSLWLCQESSGNLADSIGSLTLTANATPLYQQTATGWTRKGVGTNGATGQRFAAAAAAGPDPSTTSQTWLWFTATPNAPASGARLAAFISTSATPFDARLVSTGIIRARVASVSTDGSENMTDDGVYPLVIKYNRTGSEAKVFTDLEKITGTYDGGAADAFKGVGGGESIALDGQVVVYGCMWSGADGEISDANIKALLQAMGWTIAWS